MVLTSRNSYNRNGRKPFLFFWLFFFFLSYSSVTSHAAYDGTDSSPLHLASRSSDLCERENISFSSQHVPVQSPEEPLPVSDEKHENKDEKDSDPFEDFARSGIHSQTHSDPANQYASLACIARNREIIPLFILYHSWKSFLT